MMRTITLQELLPVLLNLKATYEDHVQDACQYTYPDETREGVCHCVAGEALSILDVPLPPMESSYNDSSVDNLEFWFRDNGIDLTPGAERVLSEAQVHADRSLPWGEAIDAALGIATRYINDAHSEGFPA